MNDTVSLLRTFDFPADLSESFLCEIAERLHETTISSGAVLFRQGDEGDALYLILDGELYIDQDGVRIVARGPGGWWANWR